MYSLLLNCVILNSLEGIKDYFTALIRNPETRPIIKIIKTIKTRDISNFQNKNLISTTLMFCKENITIIKIKTIPIIIFKFIDLKPLFSFKIN